MDNSYLSTKIPIIFSVFRTYPQLLIIQFLQEIYRKESINFMKTIEEYWSAALDVLSESLSPIIFNTYIQTLIPLRCDGDVFVFSIKIDVSQYRDLVKKKCSTEITNALTTVYGKPMSFVIVLPNEEGYNTPQQNHPAKDINTKNAYGIIPKYKFDNFIVGSSNNMAHAAALAVADSPGEIYNPLFLYGGVGLGKTHLMHAIGNYVLEKYPDYKVLYVTTEKFTNEFIESLRNNTTYNSTAEFREKYRNIDVLLLDDIQFLSEKEATQNEFFHTFNELITSGKQIVICSDRKPSEIKTLTDRLVSRMQSGLITDIVYPDYETRTAILEKKAELMSLSIPNEVLEYVAKAVTSNIREMEGVLTRIIAYAKVTNRVIDLSLAEEAVKDIIKTNRANITIEYIQETVASYYKITVDELKSKRRTKPLTIYRHIAMYLCRKLLDDSLEEIGSKFGGRDHSTVMNGCDKVSALIENNDKFSVDVAAIEKRING